MPEAAFQTDIGICRLGWECGGVTWFRLPENPVQGSAVGHDAALPETVRALIGRVQAHLAGNLQDFADVGLDFSGTSSFQRSVYEAALRVKPGSTRTYGWLARECGFPVSASRAVGTALGQNPWPLLVPCHRFVGANGKMTGFSAPGGIETKLRLLAIEGAELFAP